MRATRPKSDLIRAFVIRLYMYNHWTSIYIDKQIQRGLVTNRTSLFSPRITIIDVFNELKTIYCLLLAFASLIAATSLILELDVRDQLSKIGYKVAYINLNQLIGVINMTSMSRS